MTPANTPLDVRNMYGSTLLHVAAIVGNIEAAEILLGRNRDLLFARDNQGHTPVLVALSNMHTKMAHHLLQHIETDLEKDTLFSGPSGDELLVGFIYCKDFRLAHDLVGRYKTLHSDVVLMAIAHNFPCELYMLEEYTLWTLNKERVRMRGDALGLLRKACKLIKDSNDPSSHHHYYTNPILEATTRNVYEVVHLIVMVFPNAIWSANKDGHNIIQHAVTSRSQRVYNLLYPMSEHNNIYRTMKDSFGNNLLHLAARLAPDNKLNLISGAPLQMQHELQWFKEVEGFVCPRSIMQKNSFGETPQMVFTREHKNLVIEGEKWMKAMAESYTITAALITTIVFAAAITLPGGNNENTGIPVFTSKTAFTMFAISNVVSLFASVTSLIMFLSILTTRYAEEDFLFKLPTKLIIGLTTLFMSTTAMVVAFGATLYLEFGQRSRILIPIAVLTCLPITSFVTLQFPLIIDLINTTYGCSIFGKKRNALFY